MRISSLNYFITGCYPKFKDANVDANKLLKKIDKAYYMYTDNPCDIYDEELKLINTFNDAIEFIKRTNVESIPQYYFFKINSDHKLISVRCKKLRMEATNNELIRYSHKVSIKEFYDIISNSNCELASIDENGIDEAVNKFNKDTIKSAKEFDIYDWTLTMFGKGQFIVTALRREGINRLDIYRGPLKDNEHIDDTDFYTGLKKLFKALYNKYGKTLKQITIPIFVRDFKYPPITHIFWNANILMPKMLEVDRRIEVIVKKSKEAMNVAKDTVKMRYDKLIENAINSAADTDKEVIPKTYNDAFEDFDLRFDFEDIDRMTRAQFERYMHNVREYRRKICKEIAPEDKAENVFVFEANERAKIEADNKRIADEYFNKRRL